MAVFSKIVNMSLTASVIILAVLLLRQFLKKAPRIFSCVLWAAVLFRLLCPVSVSSAFSLLGVIEHAVEDTQVESSLSGISFLTETEAAQNNENLVDDTQSDSVSSLAGRPQTEVLPQTDVNPVPSAGVHPEPDHSRYINSLLWKWSSVLWLCGVVGFTLYSGIHFLLFRRKLAGAVRLSGNVYLSDYISMPFVTGFFRPRIYLPSGLDEKEQSYILLHEEYHIRRLDHVTRFLAFAARTVHWFNPLVWIAFHLSGKDMEMSCDEAVMKAMKEDIRKDYSRSLLHLASGKRRLIHVPLAFGESDTKARIRHVMSYRKPAFWTVLAAAVLCVTAIVFLFSDPKQETVTVEPFGHSYRVAELLYSAPQYSFVAGASNTPGYCLTDDRSLMVRDMNQLSSSENLNWRIVDKLESVTLTEENFDQYFANNGTNGLWKDTSAEIIRRENVQAWQAYDKNGETSVFYYILQQENGDLYFTYGYYDGDGISFEGTSIRWLFLMKEADRVANDAGYTYDCYRFEESVDPGNPSLMLSRIDNYFSFSWSLYSSYIAVGEYELTKDTLTLHTYDGIYTFVFDVVGDGFSFDADRSSQIPEYRYFTKGKKESPVPDGAQFSFKGTQKKMTYESDSVAMGSGVNPEPSSEPEVSVIQSKEELETNIWWKTTKSKVPSGKYTETWFEDHTLLFVTMHMGTGSPQHEVMGVALSDNDVSTQLFVEISRYMTVRIYSDEDWDIPSYDEMAFDESIENWNILVEIEKTGLTAENVHINIVEEVRPIYMEEPKAASYSTWELVRQLIQEADKTELFYYWKTDSKNFTDGYEAMKATCTTLSVLSGRRDAGTEILHRYLEKVDEQEPGYIHRIQDMELICLEIFLAQEEIRSTLSKEEQLMLDSIPKILDFLSDEERERLCEQAMTDASLQD